MATSEAAKGQEGGSGFYPRTREAFSALIEVEIWARQLLEDAEGFEKALQPVEKDATLWYQPPPHEDDESAFKELIEGQRRQMPRKFRTLWRAADRWYGSERRFRKVVEAAKLAVDRAGMELDTPTTPPLHRTSIAIKRSLRDLSGSVPYPRASGWAEGARRPVIHGIQTALKPVYVWTDELRLLVQPEHSVCPPMTSLLSSDSPSVKSRPRGARTRKRGPRLSERELDVIDAMRELGAVLVEADLQSAPVIADKAFGAPNDGLVRGLLSGLRRKSIVDSKEGRGGGSWLTEKGLALLEEVRPQTLKNSQ